jgi:peptidoglycan/xylan/chitin deacetylase (PgdA/CDA1 family)
MLTTLKNKVRGFISRDEALVLTYHSVHRRNLPFPVWHHMDLEKFEEQIDCIARNYHCVSTSQLLADMHRGRLQPYSVVVTFDDGFANNLHVALPVLKRYGVPATFFLTAGTIGSQLLLWSEKLELILEMAQLPDVTHRGLQLSLQDPPAKSRSYRAVVGVCKTLAREEVSPYLESLAQALGVPEEAMRTHPQWDQYRMLSWEEVAILQQSELVEFGAHTVTHSVLSRLSKERAWEEIAGSKQMLEKHLKSVAYFAYPHGGTADFNPEHRQMAIDAGYAAVFTAESACVRHTTDVFAMPRLGVGGEMALDQFEYALHGGVAISSH